MPLRVMTFNVFSPGEPEREEDRVPGEREHAWEARAGLNVRTIRRYRPHLIGFQEVDREKLETYRRALDEYGFAEPADDAEPGPIIFWRRDQCEPVAAGRFWLSGTPDEPSADWGVEEPLPVEWVRLRLASELGAGAELLHLNTQFEDGPWGERSRVESSRLLARRTAALQGHASDRPPVVLTGDFNCNPWSRPYRLLLAAGFVDAHRAAGHGDSAASSTFHGLRGADYFALEWGGEVFWRVDWILTRDGAQPVRTTSCTIVRDAEPPVYPSDHWPVVAELVLG